MADTEPEYLSAEWFDALAARLARSGPLAGDGSVRLGQLVTEVPETATGEGSESGERGYTLVLNGGETPRIEETLERADVVIVESYEDARAVASGELSPARLLEEGRAKIRGDARVLVRAFELLEAAFGAEAVTKPSPGDLS